MDRRVDVADLRSEDKVNKSPESSCSRSSKSQGDGLWAQSLMGRAADGEGGASTCSAPQGVTGMMGHEDRGRRGTRLLPDAAEEVSAHAVAMPTTQSHANTRQAGPSRAEPRPAAHAVTSLLGGDRDRLAGPQTKG